MRARRSLLRMISVASMALLLAACGARHKGVAAGGASGSAEASAARHATSNGANQTPPVATVQIDYSRRDDFLSSVTVTKFTAARLIPIAAREEKASASIVRFEGGGVPVWQIHADEGMARELLTEIPLIAAGSKYALSKLEYGVLPKNFLQSIPEAEPPEPLEAGSYYVFEVDRASGSISFDAIKVGLDGAIESYDAQPRAGQSYALCCNVTAGFVSAEQP